MRINMPLFASTALILALVSSSADATRVFNVPLKQMAQESEVIVHARVVGQRVTWDEKRARILTYTDLEVLDGIRGAKNGDALTVYQVGGTLDGVTFHVEGRVMFEPGEHMVFFAQPFRGQIVSYGMGLGKFAVLEVNGKAMVAPDFGDVAFVKQGNKGLEAAEAPVGEPELLSSFLRRVRGYVRGEQ